MSTRDTITVGHFTDTGDECSNPFTNLGFQPSMVMIKKNSSDMTTTVQNGGSITSNNITNNTWMRGDISSHNANFDGVLTVKGDINMGGESLTALLEDIRDRLAILRPNEDLESRWDQLKELRRQYVEMERDILEKEEILRILKE